MLRLGICDDDLNFAQCLSKLIQRTFAQEIMVDTYRSGLQLWHDISNRLAVFDLLLMDVQMPVLDGIEACIRIRQKDVFVPIIFISHHGDQMPRSFQARPYDFLTKPVEEDRLIQVVGQALSYVKLLRPHYTLLVETRQSSLHLPLGEILYIESHGRKLIVHTDSGTHQMNAKISHMAARLVDCGFALAHRCILVNLYAVRHVDYPHRLILMRSGEQLPLSANRIQTFKLAQHQLLRLRV